MVNGDSYEEFIYRFHRSARDCRWNDREKTLYLIGCLEGKNSRDEETNAAFNMMKAGLNRQFAIDEEQLMRRFRSAKIEADENG